MAKIRARARAVDMLGRQQIAGIQNALSELFKNAHDAYAHNASVDYFESAGAKNEGYLVIRDDGVGMTREDFEEKWLILGTESKTEGHRSQLYRPPDMEVRTITGEKGIGRLAIALLGHQVVVLTRAVREDGLHDLVVAFVHWGLYEIPALNLEDIEIPITVCPGGSLPTVDDISGLRAQLKECVDRLAAERPSVDLTKVRADLDAFAPDPVDLDGFFSSRESSSLSLKDKGTGTHFLIGPSNPVLKIELDHEDRNDDYSFRKQLLGFCDQTFDRTPPPLVTTSFRRWLPGQVIGTDLLDAENFFTRAELHDRSDHLLRGRVDEYGQFSGSLRVYDKEYSPITIPWPDAKGKHTRCGPFNVTFGYLMGRNSESIVPDAEFAAMNRKLEHLGGMYVYRDGIRILPYGDHSNDWLEVEKRRNKGAGYYFFSYRRMFGAVILTRSENGDLPEKAGREGFQQNEAYRQLRDICMNLLVQLAAEFFRKDSTHGDVFERTQEEIRKRSEALERQQKRASTKRKLFVSEISSFEEMVNSGLPQTTIANLRKVTQSQMDAASKIQDQDKAAAALIRAEQQATVSLEELRRKFTLKRPTGVALTKELARQWEAYGNQKAQLERELFVPFDEEISKTLGQVASQARVYVDQRKRLEERIKALAESRKKELAEISKEANATANETRATVFGITEKARAALEQTIKNIEVDLNSTDLAALDLGKIEAIRRKWEDQLVEIESRHRDALIAARDMLASLAENLQSSGDEPAQVMEALEQRMLALEEQTNDDFEMVQLGLAVAIINHEFAASIKRVRASVRELGQISKKADALKPLYESIRANFDHLDAHLNLFTPLQRRLHRTAQTISGKSIRNYVTDLFANRFIRHNVSLECTESFLNATVDCYPSTLYPAIINLVDNAVFWLSNRATGRAILLDASAGGMVVANNGIAIDERDYHRIFERGFSRKPGGRGLGLFISSRALNAENMSLAVADPPPGFTAAFSISMPTLKLNP